MAAHPPSDRRRLRPGVGHRLVVRRAVHRRGDPGRRRAVAAGGTPRGGPTRADRGRRQPGRRHPARGRRPAAAVRRHGRDPERSRRLGLRSGGGHRADGHRGGCAGLRDPRGAHDRDLAPATTRVRAADRRGERAGRHGRRHRPARPAGPHQSAFGRLAQRRSRPGRRLADGRPGRPDGPRRTGAGPRRRAAPSSPTERTGPAGRPRWRADSGQGGPPTVVRRFRPGPAPRGSRCRRC